MKQIIRYALGIIITFLISSNLQAQKIKFIEGDKKVLANINQIAIQFTYDNMSVGKFDKEADYVDKKRSEYNAKEAGKGDKWQKEWIGDRTARYEPEFITLFKKHSSGVVVKNDAPYTMIVKTKHTEPGFNIAIARKNAEISGEIWILNASGTVVAKISFDKAPGRTFGGYDYDTGYRIQEAYAALGKSIAKLF